MQQITGVVPYQDEGEVNWGDTLIQEFFLLLELYF